MPSKQMQKVYCFAAPVLVIGVTWFLWHYSTLQNGPKLQAPIRTQAAASLCAVDFLRRAGANVSNLDLTRTTVKSDRLKGQPAWIVEIPHKDALHMSSNQVVLVYEKGYLSYYQKLTNGQEIEISGDLSTIDRSSAVAR